MFGYNKRKNAADIDIDIDIGKAMEVVAPATDSNGRLDDYDRRREGCAFLPLCLALRQRVLLFEFRRD